MHNIIQNLLHDRFTSSCGRLLDLVEKVSKLFNGRQFVLSREAHNHLEGRLVHGLGAGTIDDGCVGGHRCGKDAHSILFVIKPTDMLLQNASIQDFSD